MPLSPARTLLCGPRYALSLDGVNDYVEVADSSSIDVDEITISLWIYQRAKVNARLVSRNFVQYIWMLGLWGSGNIFYGEVWDEDGTRYDAYIAFNPPLNTWFHMAMTAKQGEKVKAYVNGVLLGESDNILAKPIRKGTRPIFIGCRDGAGDFFNGIIDGVCIYSRALSDKEITWNFNHRDNPVRNGLVLWLHWDSIDIDAGMWYDKSAFGNHGTIYGATLVEPIRAKARTLSPVRVLTPVR